MNRTSFALPVLLLAAGLLATSSASAAEYKCNGSRVEKSGLTQYQIKESGGGLVVDKGGLTRGRAVKRGDKWAVEVGGLTKATFDSRSIYKGGLTWRSVRDAQSVFDCSPSRAATLYVLKKLGRL